MCYRLFSDVTLIEALDNAPKEREKRRERQREEKQRTKKRRDEGREGKGHEEKPKRDLAASVLVSIFHPHSLAP